MTEEIGWASLGIVPTLDRGFDSKLSRGLDPALSRVGQSSGKRFGSIMGKAAVVGAAGIIGAGFAAFRFGQDALGEAREAQEVGLTTVAILASTDHAANLTRKSYDALTKSLMRKTAIDDEQIATGGNLLLTFKNVKREGKGLKDVFGRALAASLDLTAAGFGSIESTSKQLGKALNDPVKGISALSRAGVTFTADQQETIKSLVEHNDLLGAQKIILKEVESQVGGTAEKQKTSAKSLATAWGNLKEELGTGLIPVVDDLADLILDKGIPAGRDFSDWMTKDGIPAVKDFAKKARPLAEEVLPAVGSALGTVRDALSKAAPLAADLVGAFNDMPDWAKKAIVAGGLGSIVASKTGILGSSKGGGSGLLGLVSKAKPLPVFVVNNGIPGVGGVGGTKAKGGKIPGAVKGLGSLLLPILPAAGAVGNDRPQTPEEELAAFKERQRAERKANGGQGLADASRDLRGLLIDPIKDSEVWLDHIAKKKVEPKFSLLGLIEADAKVKKFRREAAKPIEVPLVAQFRDAVEGLFGDVIDDNPGGAGDLLSGPLGRKQGGVTVNVDKVVAQDYADMMRQFRLRSQQANLGGKAS